MIRPLPDLLVEPVLRRSFAEDLGRGGDVTARACVPEGARMRADFAARAPGVVAGIDIVRLAIRLLDPNAQIRLLLRDGDSFQSGAVLAEVEADAHALLAAERTALNLLGRLSGIATLTRSFVSEVSETGARIADTRKTTPGLRHLEKHAVLCGGGLNHRFGLDDAILIKDNHIAVCGGVREAVRRARAAAGHLTKVEVEVDGLEQFEEALSEDPDVILLDNFTLPMLRQAVGRAKDVVRPPVLEASGGINLATVRSVAQTGVNVISVGALTHSAPSLDVGLDAKMG